MSITFDVLNRFQQNKVFVDITDIGKFTEPKMKMVHLLPWEP